MLLSSIDTKELLKAPVASISNVLAGAMPGVSTVQTSGQPGDDAASIFVRGSGSLTGGASSPLILVDGVEREFSQIDPNEIENLSILKDASATAVFGVRGANGVVLVTTRRGKIRQADYQCQHHYRCAATAIIRPANRKLRVRPLLEHEATK